MSRWEKMREKGNVRLEGAFWMLVVGGAGQGAPRYVLTGPQDGSISECSRSTQGLLLRELACLGVLSEALPPSCSGELRVPIGMLSSSARGWREEAQSRRPGSPWRTLSCFNKISIEPKCLLASGHFGCWAGLS